MVAPPSLATMGDERFVSLTMFRKSGEPVSTAVWIGRDGDAVIVITPEASGKVKRLRNNPRVELRPCNRFGKVADGANPVMGTAEILSNAASEPRLTKIIRDKYGLEYRLVMGVERLLKRGNSQRLILRITAA